MKFSRLALPVSALLLSACSTHYAYKQTPTLTRLASSSHEAAEALQTAEWNSLRYELLMPDEPQAGARPVATLADLTCWRDTTRQLNRQAIESFAEASETLERVSHLEDLKVDLQLLKRLFQRRAEWRAAQAPAQTYALWNADCRQRLARDQALLGHYRPANPAADVLQRPAWHIRPSRELLPDVVTDLISFNGLTQKVVGLLESVQREAAVRSALGTMLPSLRQSLDWLATDQHLEDSLARQRLTLLLRLNSQHRALLAARESASFPTPADLTLVDDLSRDLQRYQRTQLCDSAEWLKATGTALNNLEIYVKKEKSSEDNLLALLEGLDGLSRQMQLLNQAFHD